MSFSISHSTGALSGMPAVRAFALYAGMALLIDFVMQVPFDPITKMLIIL